MLTTVEKLTENSEERRRHPRFIKRIPVKFFLGRECLTSLSSDVSESGLFLRTNRGTSIDSIISIQLLLPYNEISYLKGIVRRTVRTPFASMKNGMGIELIEKDEAYGHFIKTIHGDSIKRTTPPELEVRKQALDETPLEAISVKTVSEERRQHKRLNIELKGMSGKMAFTSYLNVIDISTGGISFEADRRLNIGRTYTLSIIHDMRTVNVKGTVVWSIMRKCRNDENGNVIPVYKAGMKFSNESREQIQEFIPLIEIALKEQHAGAPLSDPSQRFRKN